MMPHQFTSKALPGILISIILCTSGAATELIGFSLPYDDGSANAASVAFLNDVPAGTRGFITVDGDRFLDGAGERIRFLGVNGSFPGNFPPKEQAKGIARRLAKFGVNCFRHHHMDSSRAPRGLISAAFADTQHIDMETLDRLDYFIYQLKQHGIYSNINLHVGRKLNSADGFDAYDLRPTYDKGIGQMHPGMIAMQKNYARDLLTHVNPYTGNAYVDEPCVAMVEITNEDGLIRYWGRGELDDLPSHYWDHVREEWNLYLTARYGDTASLMAAWQPATATDGPELLNQDFTTQWWTQIVSPASAVTQILPTGGPSGEAALHINITSADTTSWHVQPMHRSLSTQKGDLMLASIWARAQPDRNASFTAMLNHDPWSSIGLSRTISLDNTWQEYIYAFTCTHTDTNARFQLGSLATATGEVWIASPSLRVIAPRGLPAGQTLETTTVAVLSFNTYNLHNATCRADWMDFFVGMEESYFAEIYDYLVDDLGVRCPVTGTQMGYGVATGQLQLDFVDAHAYWHHPNFPNVRWSSTDWKVINESIQNRLADSSITDLAQRRPYGKPYTITEYNHPAPMTYSAETFLMLAAYGALQDWDGIFVYSYSHGDYENRSIDNFFDAVGHTPKMLTLPAAAAIFRRGDVQAAGTVLSVTLSRGELINRMVGSPGSSSQHVTDYLGLAEHEALSHQIGTMVLSSSVPISVTTTLAAKPTSATADTGEIIWDGASVDKACTLVKTSRSKAVIGFVNGRTFDLGDGVSVTPATTEQDWICMSMTVVAGDSFISDGTWLITLTGYAENAGMVWTDASKSSCSDQWGSGPPMVEAPTVEITLPWTAGQVSVFALDETGEPKTYVPVSPGTQPGSCILELNSNYESLWYQVNVGSAAVRRNQYPE
jgi:hypothetical protein